MESWLKKFVWDEMGGQQVSDEELLLCDTWISFLNLSDFLRRKLADLLKKVQDLRSWAVIYPPEERIMLWSYMCDPADVKVIIVGQDPYHGGQATGFAFSVSRQCAIPPSLMNIYKEISRSCPGFSIPSHGCIDEWSRRGVLLLNTALTVEKGRPGSHNDLGWTWFTNLILCTLSEKLEGCVFMLWGAKAVDKARLLDESRHLVLRCQHPSPLALRNGRSLLHTFSGSDHFKLANEYLARSGKTPIDWTLD
ncbi:UL2 [Phascolarctid gammaherpesvirus 1]|uniref:UL2 n=1 Tax=Phascolarctid gammaherpesvirus 1 TaxID=2249313 RepID=A0A3S8D7U8_9GAMA|nr:UL2 [Phascolarctid gammaherpesvirus 1]AZB49216.1 UL2 [Phascolarctid gammaherpesvirus 1]